MLQTLPELNIDLIPFVEGSFPITISGLLLELEAQAASEEPIGRYEDNLAVTGGESNVTLSEQVAAVGQNFGVTRDESG